MLDVSCGTGNYAIALAAGKSRVVAIDPSEKMLAIARSKAARARLCIDFRLGAAEDLLREMFRVLKNWQIF